MRPQTRADCPEMVDGRRVCPWVGCRHHLGLDITRGGGIQVHHDPPWEADPCCSLDVAERGGLGLQETGDIYGKISRERVRQIQVVGMRKIRRAMVHAHGLAEHVTDMLDELDDARSAGLNEVFMAPHDVLLRKPRRRRRSASQKFSAAVSRASAEAMAEAIRGLGPVDATRASRESGRSMSYTSSLLAACVRMGLAERVSRGVYRVE